MLGTWAKTTLIDTDSCVADFSPVIRDPDMQAYLTDQVSVALEQTIDAEQVVGDAVGALQWAVGERRAAVAALGLLEQPAIEGIRGVIARATGQVITSQAFAATWDQTLRNQPHATDRGAERRPVDPRHHHGRRPGQSGWDRSSNGSRPT